MRSWSSSWRLPTGAGDAGHPRIHTRRCQPGAARPPCRHDQGPRGADPLAAPRESYGTDARPGSRGGVPGAGRAPRLRRAGRGQQPRCHRCVRRRGHRLRAHPRRDRGHPDGGGHRRARRRARRGGDGRGAGRRQRRQRHRLCRAGEGARAPRHRCARGARAGPPRPAPAFRPARPLRTPGQGLRETGARRRAGRDRLAARYGGGAPGGPRAARPHDGGSHGPRRACLRQAEGGEDGRQVVRPRHAGGGARPARRLGTAPDRRRHGSARAGGECGTESARAGARLPGDDHLQGQGRDRRRRSPRRRLLHRGLGRCALPRPGRPA